MCVFGFFLFKHVMWKSIPKLQAQRVLVQGSIGWRPGGAVDSGDFG